METHDDYYCLKGTLQNLMLMKLAFDYGLDSKIFSGYIVNYDFGQEYDWDIFMTTVETLFTVVECWFPHSGEDDIEEKKYWCERAGIYESANDLETLGVLVLLDDCINHTKVPSGSIGGTSDLYCGFGEISTFENGVLVTWYEDDGPIDLVDLLYFLLSIMPERKEQNNNYAVAI